MIRFRLAELMADHQFKHGRRITVKDLSEATGINRNTLSRMANTRGYSTSTDTLDKLCKFFGCDVGDLARYLDDPSPASLQADDGARAQDEMQPSILSAAIEGDKKLPGRERATREQAARGAGKG